MMDDGYKRPLYDTISSLQRLLKLISLKLLPRNIKPFHVPVTRQHSSVAITPSSFSPWLWMNFAADPSSLRSEDGGVFCCNGHWYNMMHVIRPVWASESFWLTDVCLSPDGKYLRRHQSGSEISSILASTPSPRSFLLSPSPCVWEYVSACPITQTGTHNAFRTDASIFDGSIVTAASCQPSFNFHCLARYGFVLSHFLFQSFL